MSAADQVTADLKRADRELVLLLAELERIRTVAAPPTAEPARQAVAREIREDIKHQRGRIDHLLAELDRVKPNWRTGG